MAANFIALSAKADEPRYRPFVLAKGNLAGQLQEHVNATAGLLQKNGFEVAGQYSPYPDTHILIISSEQLRRDAAQSETGGYGAMQRVSLSKTADGIQLSYTNPVYMAHVYRLKTDLADVSAQLAKLLGREKEYGSEKGLTKEELRDYQYKWLMPYFTDRQELADYGNQEKALAAVEKTMAGKPDGARKVYRLDLPGKEESVIGVALPGPENNDCSGDQYIMSRIDFKKVKSAAHLPYEVLVARGKVYALFAEFRIAINFPDLSMVGSNSFASIMCAPASIKKALTRAVGGKEE